MCTVLCTAEEHIKDQSIDIGAVNCVQYCVQHRSTLKIRVLISEQ